MKRNARSPIFADVIIAGGGPSGLSLAAALGTEGFKVLVLERAPKQPPKPDGRTIALSLRAAKFYRHAGVAQLIEKDWCPILAIRVADQDSPQHLDFHHREVGGEPFGFILETHLFQRALQKRVTRLKNIRVVHNARIKNMSCKGAVACATLEDGRVFAAPLIVAADGRHSQSRAAAGIQTYGWNYKQTAIVCLMRHSRPHRNIAVEHFQPGGPFAVLPMTKQRSSIVWTEKSLAAEALMKMNAQEFTALLQEKTGDYLGTVELASARFAFPLALTHAERYVGERLALIGDAAHGIHPIAGQGFNLGVGDIEALTEELTRAASLGLDLGHPLLCGAMRSAANSTTAIWC